MDVTDGVDATVCLTDLSGDGFPSGSFLTLAKAFVILFVTPFRIKKARVDGRRFRHGMLIFIERD